MKRLVCCLDGTWNTPDQEGNPTNVTELMRAIRPADDHGTHQIVFYDKGVGTGGWINRLRGGALGRGLGENVQDAYRFLVNNHEPGDEIHVFGFSRGAFTARSLCGLIGRVGLLRDERDCTTKDAWDAYRLRQDDPERAERLAMVRRCTEPGVRVRLVGVWDTVGALGIPDGILSWNMRRKFAFHDTTLGHGIDHAFHALAIDELRGPFAPTLWRQPEGESLPATDNADSGHDDPVVEQAWFPGVHSDVGGGYADNRLSRLPLDWMVRRAERTTGLAFRHAPADRGHALAPAHESRSLKYALDRLLPMLRVLGGRIPEGLGALARLRAKRRQRNVDGTAVNEFIHRAALDRMGRDLKVIGRVRGAINKRYEPPNLTAARAELPVIEYDGSITRAT